MPKLLHGEYDDEAQNGVMVFTDYRENHYELADSDLKRISSQNQIEKVISTLATFHSICTAFEQSHGSSFERIFPFLSTDQGDKNILCHLNLWSRSRKSLDMDGTLDSNFYSLWGGPDNLDNFTTSQSILFKSTFLGLSI